MKKKNREKYKKKEMKKIQCQDRHSLKKRRNMKRRDKKVRSSGIDLEKKRNGMQKKGNKAINE